MLNVIWTQNDVENLLYCIFSDVVTEVCIHATVGVRSSQWDEGPGDQDRDGMDHVGWRGKFGAIVIDVTYRHLWWHKKVNIQFTQPKQLLTEWTIWAYESNVAFCKSISEIN